jgi:hypothetical protein
LLKGFAFLLAAFGIAEIAYVTPTHTTYRRPRKGYLTPYDGLRFVRLTPLGEFVFRRRDHYELAAGPPTRSPVVLDEDEIRRLFASDPVLREIVLKVEGLRIAVRQGDLKKLAKRLEQFGYLSPIPRVT